jgi:uncharacterized protein YciI
MPYAIIAQDKPGHAALRAELRPAHLDHLARHAAKLLAAGPLLDEAAGNAPSGSLIILDAEDRVEVEAFLAADPYTQGGLFERVIVAPWHTVFLDGKRVA